MNLRLLQLGDSALPIGGYSHSWGLEAAVERGMVYDAAHLENWVYHWLHDSLGPFEGVIVSAVCRAVNSADWSTVCQANEYLEVGLIPSTLRHASREMGGQLLGLAETWPWAEEYAAALRRASSVAGGPWHHAPVFATLAAATACSPVEAVAVYLHQAALGMISAGVRAIPIGHTHGQQILARLHDDIPALAAALTPRPLATAGSNCTAYEVLCHAQSQLYTRLFRS